MMFPDFQTWCRDVLHPDDTGWWDFKTPEWHAYYLNKYTIARALRLSSVLELGVRFGYSAHALLCAAPEATYIGVDSDNPEHGGWWEPTLSHAEAMLRRVLPSSRLLMVKGTTDEALRRYPLNKGRTYDLVHVDADHGYLACLCDLTHYWPFTGRAMLVDDYDDCPMVKKAVDHFCTTNGVLKFTASSLRGEALLLK